MPIDLLAHYSDVAFGSALAVYVLAMVAHATDYALSRRIAAAEPVRSAVLVGTGGTSGLGGPGDTGGPGVQSDPGSQPPRSPAERAGRAGVALTGLGLALHAGSVLLRGVAAGRPPWGNMYEFSAAICLVAVTAWLVVLYRQGRSGRNPGLRRLGLFVLLPVVVLMFLAGTVLYARAAPVMPALQSYWLTIHVSTASIASGILLVAGVASALFVVRSRHEANPARFPWFGARLPASDTLDRLAYRATTLAFPIWTFAIMTGAIWAEAAWGKYWGWDPKETTALVAWVCYAGYLHARATAGWRGRPSAVINLVGFGVMIFNLFFINLVTAGLHSYAGVG